MQVQCAYERCGSLHRHHEWSDDQPDPPRASWTIPDDSADVPRYCSVTCACYAGAYSVTKGWLNEQHTK